MNNLKIKTFTFEDNDIFKYNENHYGEQKYISNTNEIDYHINEFLNDKNINIIDIKINSIVKGNNPPTSILIYTIIYTELEKEVLNYE